MEFLTVHFTLLIISAIISAVVLVLAGLDHGTSSFYLMLLTPSLTVIHHAVVIFLPTLPTYTEDIFTDAKNSSRSGSNSKPNLSTASPITIKTSKGSPNGVPAHATPTYLAFLCLLAVLWTLSTMLTFYTIGMEGAEGTQPGPSYYGQTGGAECVFGVLECAVLWAMFVLCIRERSRMVYRNISPDGVA